MADWKTTCPVVVFESDDWGMQRMPCSDLLQDYGQPSEWALESLESQEDLEALYNILEEFRDRSGRPACFTANFVVANPDCVAIEQNAFQSYVEIPITSLKHLVEPWRDGIRRKVFHPQYHARHHCWVPRWMQDLRDDEPGARQLLRAGAYGGLSLVRGKLWRYHSEYLPWPQAELVTDEELDRLLSGSMAIFNNAFGYQPKSTVAPHYIYTRKVARAFNRAGFLSVQGCGYRILPTKLGTKAYISHAMGERSPEDLTCLVRRVKFEPALGRESQGAADAIKSAERCFANCTPAIVDTHRINYTGGLARQGREALKALLTSLQRWNPLFLTSTELAEAIRSPDGVFRDAWSGELRPLQLSGTITSPLASHAFAFITAQQERALN